MPYDVEAAVGNPDHNGFYADVEAKILNDAASSICIDDHADDDVELAGEAHGIIENSGGMQQLSEYEQYIQQAARDLLSREGGVRRLRFDADSATFYAPERYGYLNESDNEDHEHSIQGETTYKKHKDSPSQQSSYDFFDRSSHDPFTSSAHASTHGTSSSFDSSSRQKKEPTVTVCDTDYGDVDSIATLNIDATGNYHPPSWRTTRLARSFGQRNFRWLTYSGGIPLSLLLASTNALLWSGPFGACLGFLIVTPIVISVVTSTAEMIAFYPMQGGFPGMVSEYVDPSLGLAVGLCYFASCVAGVPVEILDSVTLTTTFPHLGAPDKSSAVFLTLFLVILFLFGILTTRLLSGAMRVASQVSALCMAMIMVFLWVFDGGGVSNATAIGFKYWDSSKSTRNETFGLFRPDYFHHFGGAVGRFCQVWYAVDQAMLSFSGIEMVYTAMPEIRNSRRTIKSSVRNLYWKIALFYLLLVFTYSLITNPNIRSFLLDTSTVPRDKWDRITYVCGSPVTRAKRVYGRNLSASWLVSLAEAGMCNVQHAISAFFIYSGVFSAVLRLYGASRTLHGMASSGLVWPIFSWCTRDNVPYVAFLFSFMMVLIAYTSVVDRAQALQYLMTFAVAAHTLTWAALCFAYIRFHKALQIKKRWTQLSRSNDDFPYRSPLQPYSAWFGLVSCLLIYFASGADTQLANSDSRRPWMPGMLVMSYAPILVASGVYLLQRYRHKTRLRPYHQIKLDAAKRQMDSEEWEEDRFYSESWLTRIYGWTQKSITRRRM